MTFLGDFRQAVQDALNTEFAADNITFEPGRLADDAGTEGAIGAVWAQGWAEVGGRVSEANVQVQVQLFDEWSSTVLAQDATFDPTIVEGWADRITSSLTAHQHDAGWFIRVTQIMVTDDPNGYPSRLLATVVGRTANPFETQGGTA